MCEHHASNHKVGKWAFTEADRNNCCFCLAEAGKFMKSLAIRDLFIS